MGHGADEVLLLLGGNLGDPVVTFLRAEEGIASRAGSIVARSRDHWTKPWGMVGGGPFLNRALLLTTDLEPDTLMALLLGIEEGLGRVRSDGPPQSRTMDIDILLWGDRIIDTPRLTVPHPRMHQRTFALGPAADIAPGMRHPVLQHTVLDLLSELRRRA